MANNLIDNKAAATDVTAQFKGYTLDKLRYRRALVALQKDFRREKIFNDIHKVQTRSPFSPNFSSGNSTSRRIGVIASKLTGGLNYLDYIMLGFSLMRSGRKVYDFVTHRFKKRR